MPIGARLIHANSFPNRSPGTIEKQNHNRYKTSNFALRINPNAWL